MESHKRIERGNTGVPRQDKPVPISKLRMISPRVADSYAKKTIMALRRDVKKLIQMDLAELTKDGLRAKREVISAFLPVCRIPIEK